AVRATAPQPLPAPGSKRLPGTTASPVPKNVPAAPGRTVGAKARGLAFLPLLAVWCVAGATWRAVRPRARLALLRRKRRRQQHTQGKFLVELGVRLLSAEVTVPQAEAVVQRFRQLSRTKQLAQMADQEGNPAQRQEARRLKGELRDLAADFARR